MTEWIRTPVTGAPVQVLGALELELTPDGVVPHRLPAAARAQIPDDFMRMCEVQPSGVRLAFRTAAQNLELDVRAARTRGVGRPVPDGGVYDLVVDGELTAQASCAVHGVVELDPLTRRTSGGPGPVGTVTFAGLPAGEKDVEIWLPYAETTRLIELRTDGTVSEVEPGPQRARPRWVHHGSSISHGASADSPTGIWPVVAARGAGLDLVNLGFSGNAVVDPFTARAIRDQPADLITLKLGINVVNGDCFRRRAFQPAVDGFLDTIREGHPTTPIVVISPILCPMVEDCPGPTLLDPASPPDAPVFITTGRPEELEAGKLSLGVIRTVLADVVARRRPEDPHLTYLDGRELFGADDWDAMPMPDLLHPDAAGQRHMGERFVELLPGLVPDLWTEVAGRAAAADVAGVA
jgi:hypothetical protein